MHELSNILIELIFILLLFFTFILNYIVSKRKLFYPPALFSLLWTVILLLHFIFEFTILKGLFPVSLETYLIIFIGTIFFSGGGYLVKQYLEKSEFLIPVEPKKTDTNLLLRILIVGVITIGLPFYVQASYRVFLASNIDNFFVGLRNELSYGDENIGITKYLISFSFVVFAINFYAYLINKNLVNKWLLGISLTLAIVYSVFATGRTYFFMIFAMYLGITYLLKKRFLIKKYILTGVVFIFLFMTIGIIYGKGGDSENSLKENIRSVSQTTSIYLVASINAFDLETVHHVKARYSGENTLLFFVKILHAMGYEPNLKEGTLVSEFVFVPYPTNVFTIFSPYIRDFGKIYAWLMIALFSAIHTWLFYKSQRTKELRYTLYYSFLLYPLLMSFFQDQYISLLSFWMQLVFYTEMYIIFNRFFLMQSTKKSS